MHIVPVENLFVSFMLLNNTFLNTTDQPAASKTSTACVALSTFPKSNLPLTTRANRVSSTSTSNIPVSNKTKDLCDLEDNKNKGVSSTVVCKPSKCTRHQTCKTPLPSVSTPVYVSVSTPVPSVSTPIPSVYDSCEKSSKTGAEDWNRKSDTSPIPYQRFPSSANITECQNITDISTLPSFLMKSYNIRLDGADGNKTCGNGGDNLTDNGLTNFTMIQEIICFPKKKPSPYHLQCINVSHPESHSGKQWNVHGNIQSQLKKKYPIYKFQHPAVRPMDQTTYVYKSMSQNKNSFPVMIHLFQRSKSLRNEANNNSRNSSDNMFQKYKFEEKKQLLQLPVIPYPDLIQEGNNILDTLQYTLESNQRNDRSPQLNPRLIKDRVRDDNRMYANGHGRLTHPDGHQLLPGYLHQRDYPFGYKTLPEVKSPIENYRAFQVPHFGGKFMIPFPNSTWSRIERF